MSSSGVSAMDSTCFNRCLSASRTSSYTVKQKQLIEECLSETEILHVSPRLWTLYNAIVTLRGQLGTLTHHSFHFERYVDWRTDETVLSTIDGIVEAEKIDNARSATHGGFEQIVTWLEAEFVKEGTSLIRGSKESAHSVHETYVALQRRNELTTKSLQTPNEE